MVKMMSQKAMNKNQTANHITEMQQKSRHARIYPYCCIPPMLSNTYIIMQFVSLCALYVFVKPSCTYTHTTQTNLQAIKN